MIHYDFGSYGVLDRDALPGDSLRVLDGGIEQRFRENYDFDNNNRPGFNGFLFQCTLKGHGYFEKNGEKVCLKKGQGFLVKMPDKSRYYIEKEEEEGWEFAYLHFAGEAVMPFYEKINSLCNSYFSLKDNSPAMGMLLKLQNRMLKGENLRRYEGGQLVYKFLCLLTEEIENPKVCEKGEDSFLEEALRIMEGEYGKLSGIEEISERFKVSPEHFSRTFRKNMGTTPIKYLTSLRIEAAMSRLLNSKDSIADIAKQVGFSGGNYFDKVFRKKIGMSPEEYRRIHK